MIKGCYFNGETSEKKDVSLSYTDEGYVAFDKSNIDYINFSELDISPRIGNTPRYIRFPDGSQFETDDNDAVDKMIKALSDDSFQGMVHKLENAKAFVFFTIATVVIFGWLFIQYGIPFFSKEIANILPEEASQYMGKGVLEIMDKSWFSKSELSLQRQNELRKLFNQLLNNIKGGENYKIEFRLGGKIQANAFALPNGVIVFTDELINLAEDDLEIAAIMLHEIGHLKNHHSLRSTIQQFSLAMFVMLVSGDVSTSSSVITAIPVMLVESGFSQDMETEADDYSFEYMKSNNINPNNFAIMMEKLEASFLPEYHECLENKKALSCIKEAVALNKTKKNHTNVLNYFSTHPSSQERMKRFKGMQEK